MHLCVPCAVDDVDVAPSCAQKIALSLKYMSAMQILGTSRHVKSFALEKLITIIVRLLRYFQN